MVKPPTMDDLGQEFMTYIGMCITEWSSVEDEIFETFQSVLGTDHDHTAILFYSAPSLETRLVLCSELLATIFPKPSRKSGGHIHDDLRAWERLCESMRVEMKIRNRLAHSPVMPYLRSGQNWLRAISRGEEIAFRLYTPLQKKNRARHAKEEPLEIGALKAHLANVAILAAGLQVWRRALPEHIAKRRPPKSRPKSG
jgi:hypothetical protein